MLLNTLSKPLKPHGYSERQRRIHAFLSEHSVGVLSSVTPDMNPHGAVLYYTINDDFMIHILTKTNTKKHDNLTHNNHVMLTVFELKDQTVVQVTGRATEQAGKNDIAKTTNAIFSRLYAEGGGVPPIIKLQAGAFTTFQIEPVQITMAVYARPDPGEYQDLFDIIESFELMPR